MRYGKKDYDIGLRIQRLIDKSGERIIDLAVELDISVPHLRRLLRAESGWEGKYVEWFAQHYNVPYDYLVFGTDSFHEKDHNVDQTLFILNEQLKEQSAKERKTAILKMLKIAVSYMEHYNKDK